MAAKNTSSDLVSGLGMAMALLQRLVNAVVAQGGYEEMLHGLSKDYSTPIINEIAAVIVSKKWRIPRSLVERLAAAESLRLIPDSARANEHDRRFAWDNIGLTERFGIPVVSFTQRLDQAPDATPMPAEIAKQLAGKSAITYPMILEWNGEPHVVVREIHSSGMDWTVGEVPQSEDYERLDLAPAKYFDLDL